MAVINHTECMGSIANPFSLAVDVHCIAYLDAEVRLLHEYGDDGIASARCRTGSAP